MSNPTPQRANRYSFRLLPRSEILRMIDACTVLGLTWFMHKEPLSERFGLYIFFDSAGMENYLNGHYEAERGAEE